MATFELRRDREGKVHAVRVKVRRVGQPHLSRTFKLLGHGQAALKVAQREAQTWAQSLERSLDGGASEMPAPLASSTPEGKTQPLVVPYAKTRVSQAFTQAATPGALGAVSPMREVPVVTEAGVWRNALVELRRGTDITLAEAYSLRWQHIDWASRTLRLVAPGGRVERNLPLSPGLAQALLSLQSRKLGLVFSQGLDWLATAWLEPMPASARRAAAAPVTATPLLPLR